MSNSVKINEVDQWIVPDLEIMEVIDLLDKVGNKIGNKVDSDGANDGDGGHDKRVSDSDG